MREGGERKPRGSLDQRLAVDRRGSTFRFVPDPETFDNIVNSPCKSLHDGVPRSQRFAIPLLDYFFPRVPPLPLPDIPDLSFARIFARDHATLLASFFSHFWRDKFSVTNLDRPSCWKKLDINLSSLKGGRRLFEEVNACRNDTRISSIVKSEINVIFFFFFERERVTLFEIIDKFEHWIIFVKHRNKEYKIIKISL